LLLPGRSLAWAQSRVGARSSRAATLRFAPVTAPAPRHPFPLVEGEHFTPEVFAELGYDNPPDLADEPPEFVGDVSAIVPELLREDQRAWASELDEAWKSRLQHASAEDEARSTDAESRLADAVAFAAWAEDRASALRARLMYVEALFDVPERRVQSVLNSRSWRLTTCLRILGGGFRTIAAKLRRDA